CMEDPLSHLPVGELIERANSKINPASGETVLTEGDIVPTRNWKNADPCTSTGCKWPKSPDGNVYVPYLISYPYSATQMQVIQKALDSFSTVSCIHFIPRTNQKAYINIKSINGCWSLIGHTGSMQTVSLAQYGCIYHQIIQHELLHVLGFHHEQSRSDRDKYIQVAWENVSDDMKGNFNIKRTLNRGTSYDYNSVMQYQRTAFSKNGLPTMIPFPDPNVAFGQATEMSQNDITRLKLLYQC
ncbi:six-cysteine containing astacin protease 4 isoform X1, partial [Silurus meridionalis]